MVMIIITITIIIIIIIIMIIIINMCVGVCGSVGRSVDTTNPLVRRVKTQNRLLQVNPLFVVATVYCSLQRSKLFSSDLWQIFVLSLKSLEHRLELYKVKHIRAKSEQ